MSDENMVDGPDTRSQPTVVRRERDNTIPEQQAEGSQPVPPVSVPNTPVQQAFQPMPIQQPTNGTRPQPNRQFSHGPQSAGPVPQPMAPTAASKRITITIPVFVIMIIGDVLGILFLFGCVLNLTDTGQQQASVDFNAVEQKCNDEDDDTTLQVGDGGASLSLSMEDDSDGKVFNCVASEVGLPDSVRSKMGSTRALDGTQSDTWDGMKVTWSYQTGGYSNSLDVVYERQK